MKVVDLARISDREFETLCAEVLGVKLGVNVKQGAPGPDGGIDGLFTIGEHLGCVMQAKHYLRSGVRTLINRLKSSEVQKAEAINAKRYVLMTSCSIGPQDRNTILEIYHGLIRDVDDIYSGDDICTLLDSPAYDWIKRKHYNLWLSDIGSLERYCGDGVNSKSEAILEDLKEDLKCAVETWAFVGARNKLFHDNVLVITGQAGCGKTTLAKQLVADLVFNDEYCLVASDYDLSTFERQMELHPERKTIFLLDDFLGMNILSVLSENRDSQIVSFIRRIKRSKTCKLILTSRTYIVNEAMIRSNKLLDARVSEHVYELSNNRIRRIDRAKIVYSHLYHGDVSSTYKDRVYEHENYFKIIDHRNFNPRIVAYSFDAAKSHLYDEREEVVLTHILGLLDNPGQIWRDCFERLNELQLQIVIIVFLVSSSMRSADEKCLKNAIRRLLAQDRFAMFRACAVDNLLNELCASLLSRTVENKRNVPTASYALFNPSIGDYIISTYGENSLLLADAVFALEDAKVVLDMYFKEIWYKASERYVETCKIAFESVAEKVEKHVSDYSPDFVLGLLGELSEYRRIGNDFIGRIARACWQSGVCFSVSASPKLVVYYLNRMLDSEIVDIACDRLSKDFLGRLMEGLDDCESLLKLKKLYDFIEEDVPVSLYETIKRYGNDWAFKIASDWAYDGSESEEDVYNHVWDCMSEAFSDFEIDEDIVSVDDCINGCDFSDYIRSSEDDGSDWEDRRDELQYARDIEDQHIRALFRRE